MTCGSRISQIQSQLFECMYYCRLLSCFVSLWLCHYYHYRTRKVCHFVVLAVYLSLVSCDITCCSALQLEKACSRLLRSRTMMMSALDVGHLFCSALFLLVLVAQWFPSLAVHFLFVSVLVLCNILFIVAYPCLVFLKLSDHYCVGLFLFPTSR